MKRALAPDTGSVERKKAGSESGEPGGKKKRVSLSCNQCKWEPDERVRALVWMFGHKEIG
jgi:hypothetical protein